MPPEIRQCAVARIEPQIGLALGLKPKQVGVHENISDSLGFLKEKGLA